MNARISFVVIGIAFCLAFTESYAQERQIGGVGLTVFTDRNLRGRSATIRDNMPNLQAIGLNDRVSSLQAGPGEQWEVCEHANYEGRCVIVSGSEPDLRRSGERHDLLGASPARRRRSSADGSRAITDRLVHRSLRPTQLSGESQELHAWSLAPFGPCGERDHWKGGVGTVRKMEL